MTGGSHAGLQEVYQLLELFVTSGSGCPHTDPEVVTCPRSSGNVAPGDSQVTGRGEAQPGWVAALAQPARLPPKNKLPPKKSRGTFLVIQPLISHGDRKSSS